ncbi:hypothetical protein CK203_043452 [Vitis vinifera]|uniref:Uncharacterized protein n=1 Tax=Vitis vinifera TaxID=29760 RepID=A0A438IAR9_VITVI|nr:hypothetical protein CK203_043452 [Vitis vinifera]
MEFGAREVAAEAPVVLLAAPEMAPEAELARESARELELEPARALEIAQSSFGGADFTEEELLLAAKAQKLAPFASFSCGLKERKTWPLWFRPFRVAEIWPERMIGEDDWRLARKMSISQQNAIFAATSQCVSQLRNECNCAAKWHTCAKIAFAIAKYPMEWDFCCEIWALPLRNCKMGAPVLRSGTRVPNSPLQLRKFSQRIPKCCGMVWQQNAQFAEYFFRLRNLAELCFCSVFTLFLLRFRSDFFLSISLHFLPPGIIQKD